MNTIKKNTYTLALLILFTVSAAFISQPIRTIKFSVLLILAISALKFLLVAFQFMELKKAHSFWKKSMVVFVSFFVLIIKLLLS